MSPPNRAGGGKGYNRCVVRPAGGHRQILHTPPFLISPTLLPLQVEAKEGDLIAALDDQLGDIVKFFMAKEAEMLGKLEQLELEVCVCGGGKLGWEGLEVRVCVCGGGQERWGERDLESRSLDFHFHIPRLR